MNWDKWSKKKNKGPLVWACEWKLSSQIILFHGVLYATLSSPHSYRCGLAGEFRRRSISPVQKAYVREMRRRFFFFFFGGCRFQFWRQGVPEELDEERELQPQRLWLQRRDSGAHESRVYEWVSIVLNLLGFWWN